VTDGHRALVTAPFRGPGLDRLRQLADVVLDPWLDAETLRIYGPDELAARIREEQADIVICEADACRDAVLDLPLVAIGSTRGDPTNVDVDGATAAGIPVLHAPGRNADAVAELTVGLILAAIRRIPASDRDVRAGEMFKDGRIPYQRFRGFEVNGRIAGIVGLGAIGRAVRWRLEGLGMRVIAHDPYVDEAAHTLDDLLAEADVVTLHGVVTDETRGMIGADQFARMKDGAVFVNAARAALHDMDALVDAVSSGKLAAAALDHFPNEYLAPDHPITAFDNVVLTPHIGGATVDVETNHSAIIADDLTRLLAGDRPRHIANPSVLEVEG
jgi:D-3-phosphoglycerate dehydrogenase